MTGLKDRQRLALYVALGLSAGSGLTLDASTAYANPDNDNIHVTVLSTDPDFSTKYASGVNATNETSSVKDNVVTIGRKSPVDTPAINGDVVGGYSDAYAVTHSTVTVDDMTLALAKSVFGGLADGDKAADDNEVTINGGTYAGSNVVYGGKSDTGTATHNKVTINGGTYDGSNAVYGGRTSGTVATTGNEVIINGGHFGSNTDVYGGESAGGTAEGAAATGNTVTITGGVFDGGNIYGGNTTGTATTTRRSSDNKVYLGAENGAYSADLTHVNIRGAKDAHTANKLFVRASNVTVGSLDNFDEYHFQLTQPTAGAVGVPVGSTMLAIGGTGGFGSNANVTMNSLHLDASEWNKDKQLYGNVGTVGLVVANGQHLAIHPVPSTNSMKRNGESGDFEYELTTDATDTQAGSYVSAEVHRNRNAEITFRGNAAANSELYAGYSAYGNNAEKNHLTVTNVPSSTTPTPGLSDAYGAKIVGEGGSAHGNVLEITGTREKNLPYAENRIANAYGAAITNAHNAGVVGGTADGEGNHVTVSDGIVDNVYGGATQGTGAVVHNTATITGGKVTNVYGGHSTGNGTVASNTATITGGTVTTNVYGGHSTGDGTVASNEVHISRGTVGTATQPATVYGGAATGSGDVTGNAVTLTGGTVRGKVVAGATTGTGVVAHNRMYLGDEGHRDLHDAHFDAAELIGSEGGASTEDNKLVVYAKNAKVKSVDHFTAYDFDLGTDVHDGDRMLTVVDAGAFNTTGNGVALDDISATTANLAQDPQDVWGAVTLIESGTSGTQLKFNMAGRELDATNTHEFALHTDSGTTETDKLLLDYNRYHGGKVVHDADTPLRKVGTETELYGGLSRTGHTTDDNELTINHLAADLTSAYGGKNEGAAGNVQANRVTVNGTAAQLPSTTEYAVDKVYGGAITNATNAGVVGGTRTVDGKTVEAGNSVTIAGGTVTNAYGGYTAGNGAVENNSVTVTGGTIQGEIYGGVSEGSGDVINNVVNLGDEKHHDLFDADLTAADLAGAKTGTGKASGNALNVYAKNADVKSVAKFDKYSFILDRAITDGATMLSVDAGGFGGEIDWNNIAVEKVSAMMTDGDKGHNPGGRVVLAEGGPGADLLKVANYKRDDRSTDKIEHVVELENPTESSAGHFEAERLLLTYAQFKNNTWTYDGADSSPTSESNEVFGGISYLGHTTEHNVLTVTGVPDDGLTAAYGGKTAAGAANTANNRVVVENTTPQTATATGGIDSVYGGYTGSAYAVGAQNQAIAGVAEKNSAKIVRGEVGQLYGGYAAGVNGRARGNEAIVSGGTVANVYGGAVESATGTASENTAVISGGTVTGEIAGARAVYDTAAGATHTLSNGNRVILGEENARRVLPTNMNVSAASIYGTDYHAPTTSAGVTGSTEQIFNGGSDQIKGNELNVTTTGVSAKKVRNFDSYIFTIGNDFKNEDTMLTLTETGFGNVTSASPATPVRVDWRNVKAHTGQLSVEPGSGVHGHNDKITLMKLDTGVTLPTDVLRFSHYEETKTAEVEGVYEKKVKPAVGSTTSSPAGSSSATDLDTSAVMLELNRFRDDTVTFDGTVLPGDNNAIYGGYSAYDHTEKDKDGHDLIVGTTTANNILHIKQGVASGANLNAYGGYSSGTRGGSENNTVYVEVPATPGTPNVVTAVYGGYANGAQAGAVRGNTVYVSGNSPATFTQGATLRDLMGGYIDSASTSEASGNAVFVEAGTIEHSIYGGYTMGSGAAKENKVIVTGGTIGVAGNGADVMAGRSASGAADNNYAVLSLSSGDSFTGNVTGGYGTTATDNTVEILAGTLTGNVYGGYATTAGTPATTGASPTAEVSALRNNKVTLRDGVTVTGNVYGGYAAANASNMTAATDSNTIDLYKAVIDGTLYGGMAQNATGQQVVSGKNNTLAVHARGAKADDFVGVQNLRFYVPEGTTAADKETMLTLNNVTHDLNAGGEKDLSNVHIGVALAGTRPSLKVGDAVSLMKVYKDNTTDATHAVAITSDTPLVNKATGMQGISLRYGFDLLTREAEAGSGKNNELYATVTSASVNPDTKSLVETRAASLAFLTSGSDLLTDAAMTAAMEVAATPASESQAGRARVDGAPKEYRMWAVQNVSSMRLNSGSHVDAKGWGLNLGFAKQRVSGRNTLTYGPFVEYGKGSYDSYLDDGLHGSGNMDYLGVGVMAKSQSENGAYVEGSVRVGRVKSDYAGTIDNTHTTYDSSSTYYAGHLGVGQEKQLKNGNVIETYAKYFFTHQGGDTAKLSTGEVYDFDAADSHRIRFGTRYTSKKGDASFYTGLAYEYEFGNDIAASFEGYNTPSPSLTGGTGILELGYRFTPQNGRATYGIQLMGMTGKRRGISGGVQMHWAF